MQALPSQAQIYGDPIIKKVTIYTGLGGVVGAGASVLWWLTDPLSPSNDFRKGFLIGFGVGCLIGFGVGVHQAFQKAIYDVDQQAFLQRPEQLPNQLPQVAPSSYLASFDNAYRSKATEYRTNLFAIDLAY